MKVLHLGIQVPNESKHHAREEISLCVDTHGGACGFCQVVIGTT